MQTTDQRILAEKMDDRQERQAALDSLCRYNDEIIGLCKSSVDMLDALEQLGVITEEEKDDANDTEDYSGAISKLMEKIEKDPNFFVDFCRRIQCEDDLSNLARNLLGRVLLAACSIACITLDLCCYDSFSPFLFRFVLQCSAM